jgi:hypothetical protein
VKPTVYVTIRGDLALVRGDDAERVATMVCTDPPWSRSGRGWVIPAAAAVDVVAYAQSAHLLAVVSDVTEDQAVGA